MARTTTSPAFTPDAHLDGHALSPLDLDGILFAPGLHGQGRIAGPHRMVLMGNRRPEQRHNAITHDLIHRPLVAVYGLHHALEHWVEELAGLFGVTVGQQLHRALEIRKEHRDLLALTFQGAFGGEDFLGEVGRGVAARNLRTRRNSWRRGGGGLRGEGGSALAAEGKAWGIHKPTIGASRAQGIPH